MAKIAEYKVKIVEDLCNLFIQYPIVGAVNMENLPAPQLQQMKKQLRGKVSLFMTKRRLMKIAIDKSKGKVKDLDHLIPHLIGMPALIFTKENPFFLFKTLKKNKSKAPAKSGQLAPRDIVIPAGPTPFAPGPIIGELAMVGIKAGVESGKVVIKQDSLVAKQGEPIKPKVAEILTRLGIEPMEVGLDLIATLENGILYLKNVLDIDQDKFLSDLTQAGRNALNVSVFASYTTKDNIELLLSKAHSEAKNLGVSQKIYDSEVIDILLSKAHGDFNAIKAATKFETVENKIIKKESTKEKVADIVKKTKEFSEGKIPSADQIIDEVNKEFPKIIEEKKEKIPSAHELAQKKSEENDDITNLTKKLMKKGTLR